MSNPSGRKATVTDPSDALASITHDAIREALHALRHHKSLADSPLLDLELVGRGLRSEGVADSAQARAWLLSRTLKEIVEAQVAARRAGTAGDDGVGLGSEDALRGLELDFHAGSTDRQAWSILHFRYLTEVEHPVDTATEATGYRHRTLHRRLARGIGLLADDLRERELEAQRPRTAESEPARSRALPLPATRLVGRTEELALVETAIESSRLVTLTGPGGTGKTRLALEAASAVRDRFPGGADFVDLSAVVGSQRVIDAVAGALDVREQPHRPLIDTLCGRLADRRRLLILDNCEHVLEHVAGLTEALLPRAPKLHVLATSREPLRAAGEQVVLVPPLALPSGDAGTDPDSLRASAAVQLFMDRARSASPSFRWTEANARAVAELCAAMDGLPLALELSAARVRVLSPAEQLARYEQLFRIPGAGRRLAQPRQQTLQSALDWSYELLDESERVLLERLSIFRGGWTLAAAEAVASGDPVEQDMVLDLLSRLVDKSLVVAERAAGGTRYRFLETIGAYARARLTERGGEGALQRRHLAFHVALALEAAPRLRESAAWLGRLEREHDNLRAAFTHAEALADAEAGLRLAAALGWSFYARGKLSEGRLLLERMVAIPGAEDWPELHHVVLDRIGTIASYQGKHDDARRFLLQALRICERLGDDRSAGNVQTDLGVEAYLRGDDEEAQRRFENALALLGDQTNILANLGLVASRRQQYDVAREHFQTVMQRARAAEDRWTIGHTLVNLARIEIERGELETARTRLEEALEIKRRFDDKTTLVFALQSLAQIDIRDREVEAAQARLAEAAGLADEAGNKAGAIAVTQRLVDLALLRDDAPRAAELLGAAMSAGQELAIQSSPAEQAEHERRLAQLRERLGLSQLEARLRAGRTLSLEDAIDLGLEHRPI